MRVWAHGGCEATSKAAHKTGQKKKPHEEGKENKTSHENSTTASCHTAHPGEPCYNAAARMGHAFECLEPGAMAQVGWSGGEPILVHEHLEAIQPACYSAVALRDGVPWHLSLRCFSEARRVPSPLSRSSVDSACPFECRSASIRAPILCRLWQNQRGPSCIASPWRVQGLRWSLGFRWDWNEQRSLTNNFAWAV